MSLELLLKFFLHGVFSKLTMNDVVLLSLLLTWNRFHILLWCFYCWLGRERIFSAKYFWSFSNSPNLIFQKVSAGIPGEWDLWHKILYVGSRTEIPIYSSGILNPYTRTQNLWPKIFRTGDSSFYFTKNSSNLSVTYTPLYYALLLVLKQKSFLRRRPCWAKLH